MGARERGAFSTLKIEEKIEIEQQMQPNMGAFRFDRVVGSWAASRGRLGPRKKLSKTIDAKNTSNVIAVDFSSRKAIAA